MAIDISNKALRGSISQILLNALISGDKYGYEICKDIEQKSNGKLLLKQPSLYSSLRRMENQGLITSYWEESDLGGRRHYYSITPKGRAHYEKKQVNWNEFGDLINALPTTDAKDDDSLVENLDEKSHESNNETLHSTGGGKESYEEISMFDKNPNKLDIEVVKQEDLFSLGTKKIMASDEPSENGETFIQFDMFDQKPNFIKTTTDSTNDVFSTFKSKYQEVANNTIEGEAEQTSEAQTDNAPDTDSEVELAQEKLDDAVILDTAETLISEDTFSELNGIDDEKTPLQEKEESNDEYPDGYKHGYDAVFLSPDETIDNSPIKSRAEIKSQDKPFETSQSGVIKDSSKKYEKVTRNFETNSFIDKQSSEKYTPKNNKFAYTKDSDNIYGGDFREIESNSLKGSLDDFLNDDSDNNKLDSVIKAPESFDELLDEEPPKSAEEEKIEAIIPKPKAFSEYDEVLKDDERIEFPRSPENKPYEKPDEYNPTKYVEPNENGMFIKELDRESPNYKDKLSNLYSDTSKVNPYNKPLEEEKVSLDSEEIFESPAKPRENVYENNLNTLQEDFGKDGIKLKLYNKTKYTTKKQKNYVSLNKLTLVQGWIVWLFMVAEIVVTGLILNANQLLPVQQLTIYYWAFGLSFIYPIYYTIMYFVDPYKKIESSFKLSISLFNKFLALLINVVFIFAINLFFGMSSLNQLAYLSYWLLPTILTTNYLISTLIYFLLLKGKKFSVW